MKKKFQEKIEKEGDREDLEEELCTLRERVAELEEAEKNRVDESELRKQIENEIKVIKIFDTTFDSTVKCQYSERLS